MGIRQTFILSLKSIIQNKMRSFLTMLGMIIGVAAVIALISLVQSFQDEMNASFDSMGANQIMVSVQQNGNKLVTEDEMFQLAEDNSDLVVGVSPTVSVSSRPKYETEQLYRTSVTGVAETYYKLKELELADGRFLQYSDVLSGHNNCVVGSFIVSELFDGENPIGEKIKIGNHNFTIVGVLTEESDSEEGSSDDCVYIPYTVATVMNGTRDVNSYYFAAVDQDRVEQAKEAFEDYLYEYYQDDDYYTVTTLTQILDAINSVMNMMSSLLGGIAGISLLVAGIGIMNIMLVSVTERVKEIGIRKSMGARKRDIMSQFVIEAAATSTIGGVIGIILGDIATRQLGKLFGMNAASSLESIILSFGISVAIGVIFGYLPANKAAKLNPIDALRSE